MRLKGAPVIRLVDYLDRLDDVGPSSSFTLLFGCSADGGGVRTLEAFFVQRAAESVARAAIVIGPPGIGKSRLCQELPAKDLRTHRAGCQLDRQECSQLDCEPVAARRQKLAARVGWHVDGAAQARVAG